MVRCALVIFCDFAVLMNTMFVVVIGKVLVITLLEMTILVRGL